MTSLLDAPADGGSPVLTMSDRFERDTPWISEESRYLHEFSRLPRLKSCNERSRCRHRFCNSCAYREARKQLQDISEGVNSFRHAVMVTLTLPEQENLLRGVVEFGQIRAAMKKKIGKYGTPAWVRSMELTATYSGWHPHEHIVLFGNDEELLRERASVIVEAWIDAAVERGIDASLRAQSVEIGDPFRLASYAVKSKLGTGLTSLAYMQQQAARGDADFADRWAEVEDLLCSMPGLRWRHSYGLSTPAPTPSINQRKQGTPTYGARDLNLFALANFIGLTSKRQQALLFSPAKVGRLRRAFPATTLSEVAHQMQHPEQKPSQFQSR